MNAHTVIHYLDLSLRLFKLFLRSEFFEDVNLAFLNSLILSVVFWFGDLNFRIEDLEMHVVKAAIESNKLSVLWEKDQVRDISVKNENCLIFFSFLHYIFF